jgi:hypothetical protein
MPDATETAVGMAATMVAAAHPPAEGVEGSEAPHFHSSSEALARGGVTTCAEVPRPSEMLHSPAIPHRVKVLHAP